MAPSERKIRRWNTMKSLSLAPETKNKHRYVQEGEEASWVLQMPGYDHEQHETFNEQLKRGEKLLNISATCIVYNFIIRTMTQVEQDLTEMVTAGKDMSFSQVRKFVVDFYMLEMADYILYTAM